MSKVTVARLIEVLNKVKDEVGGDVEVNLFNGNEYTNPPSDDSYGETMEVVDVMVSGAKSFMSTKSRRNDDEDGVKVWIKYE